MTLENADFIWLADSEEGVAQALDVVKKIQREAKEATRNLLDLDAAKKLHDANWDRQADFILILAGKHQGMAYADMEFIIEWPRDVSNKIAELREEGYKIFTVLQPLGVVDDFMAEHEGRRGGR
ncbi:hypothetical protein KM908_14510 [Alkalihalobacillus clausii]|uniref:hypothetical protein n=1 Tax=Shouchella clausii TaxID=79880 RepID=UPI001C219A69|nr:hypothetical protein [Shouchella clausii]MBU8597355.1 hypothetical protein [Shouchella clausii]